MVDSILSGHSMAAETDDPERASASRCAKMLHDFEVHRRRHSFKARYEALILRDMRVLGVSRQERCRLGTFCHTENL